MLNREVFFNNSDFILFVKDTYQLEMESKIRIRKCIMVCLLFTITGIVYFGYFCTDNICFLTTNKNRLYKLPSYKENNIEKYSTIYSKINFYKTSGLSFDDIINDKFHFDMNGYDVMVFLHIQKTGGTSFGRHLVQDLDLQRPCTCQRKHKRCYCFRPNRNENWLFSRYSTGWKCGLHADWTELTNCVDIELDKNEGDLVKRRYFYITLIRDPISRFLSEFKHVQRGATWRNSRHWCNGRVPTKEELPKCYNGSTWKNVSLDEFVNCPHNLASNRQTRMISDLSLVGCYNKSYLDSKERDKIILESAKRNLASMSFFSLTEYQKIGQYLFEEVFNLRFAVPFAQYNFTRSSNYISKLTTEEIKKIRSVNSLDLELYDFAKSLLFSRFEKISSKDLNFKDRWKHLGELSVQTEFNWDEEIESSVDAKNSVNT